MRYTQDEQGREQLKRTILYHLKGSGRRGLSFDEIQFRVTGGIRWSIRTRHILGELLEAGEVVVEKERYRVHPCLKEHQVKELAELQKESRSLEASIARDQHRLAEVNRKMCELMDDIHSD